MASALGQEQPSGFVGQDYRFSCRRRISHKFLDEGLSRVGPSGETQMHRLEQATHPPRSEVVDACTRALRPTR